MASEEKQAEGRYRLLAAVCGSLVIATGFSALIGWISGFLPLATFVSGGIPMAPSTALFFISYGSAILLRVLIPANVVVRGACLMINGAGVVVASLLFVLSCFRVYSSAEYLGIPIGGVVSRAPLGHMSPVTAFWFIISGLSFLLSYDRSGERSRRPTAAWWLASFLVAACAVFLLAYLYGDPLLYGGPLIPPAVTSVVAFAVLGTALLALAVPWAWLPQRLDKMTKGSGYVLILVFAVLVVGIASAGYLNYRHYEKQYRVEMDRQLSAVAELKVSELVQWRKDRLGDAATISGNSAFSSLVRSYFSNPGDQDARRQLSSWIGRIQEAYRYDCVFLLDAGNAVRAAAPSMDKPVAAYIAENASRTLGSRQVLFLDFHRLGEDQTVYLSVMVPILDVENQDRPLAVLVLRINPEKYLYPLIQRWPTDSKTAESLLVRREGNEIFYLNELRFREKAALNLRMPLEGVDLPAAMAIRGHEGVFDGIDYRGVSVAAALRSIPDSPWFLVAKMDTTEVYAPIYQRLWLTIALVVAMVVGAGAVLGLAWRQQSAAYYKEKYRAERERAWLHDVISRSLNEIYMFSPETLQFTFANAGASANIGYTLEEMKGMTLLDIEPEFSEDRFRATIEPLKQANQERLVFEANHRRKDGSYYPVEVYLQLLDTEGGPLFLAVINDITERKKAEENLRFSLRLLEIVHSHVELSSLLKSFVSEIRRYSGCEAVGIRVLGEKGEIPYRAYEGFSDDFYERENLLCIETDKCMCIYVIGGSLDPAVPFCTEGGSFYSNSTSRLLATLSEEEKGRMRNACNLEGYESVALVPFHAAGRIAGLIHVVDRRENMVPFELVEMLGKASMLLGTAIERVQAEDALRESEEKFRTLFETMTEGVALHEMVYDPGGNAIDYRVLMANMAFEKHTELSVEKAEGELASRLYGIGVAPFLKEFEHVARTGEPLAFEVYFPPMKRHLHIAASSPRKGFFATLFEDITERKRQEQDLRDKNAELERFTYTVSHDLKSPLVTVKTFLGYLVEDMKRGDQGRIEQDMTYMRTATDRMGRLLDELLDLTRVGRKANPPVDVSFQDLVREATDLVAGRIAQRGVEVRIGDTGLVLSGDRPRLVEVWQNLIENSVKFMDDQQEPLIEIGVETVGSESVFFVRDNGRGIDPRYRDKVFGLFEKLDPGSEGTGIGLAMVRRIVELYGGTIWVESEGAGKGTVFRFTLPGAVKGAEE